eukprot:scaffold3810_cov120-Isochrysis_galbana.AAC.8
MALFPCRSKANRRPARLLFFSVGAVSSESVLIPTVESGAAAGLERGRDDPLTIPERLDSDSSTARSY